MWRNCCFNLFFANGDREQQSDREEDASLFIHDENDKEGSEGKSPDKEERLE